ncbi:MAG: ABC transporter substrate binding protein [Desulfuromusa sp.]|nr:ABC transporter substrate binding protein [Desulfuromusa sp.]
MYIIFSHRFWLLLFFCGNLLWVSPALAEDRFKVLVVLSYEQDYLWEIEIREEIERVLSPFADLTFFYMNTKVALGNGSKKAAEAFALYQKLQPDGVITVDDNAQALFVVPYLKNRVSTPVIFCGVNAEPEVYGYPAENVSGILERYHFEETLSFNRQIAGKTDTFALMVNESPLADLIAKELKAETGKLSAEMIVFLRPKTLSHAVNMAENIRHKADLLMLLTLNGLVDNQGKPVSDAEAISIVVKAFNKPTTATAAFAVKNGVLSGVLASGQEQGEQAALMLLKALRGVPIDQLPVTRNSRGKRMINVSTLQQLGITLPPMVLRGAELVRSPKK